MSLRPCLAVITNKIICHRIFGLSKTSIAKLRNPFTFQTPEESFPRCVVPAVAASAHALVDLIAALLIMVENNPLKR